MHVTDTSRPLLIPTAAGCCALLLALALAVDGFSFFTVAIASAPLILWLLDRYGSDMGLAAVIVALCMHLTGLDVTKPLATSAGNIYVSDVIVGIVVIYWIVQWVGLPRNQTPLRLSAMFSAVAVLLLLALLPGIVRGHDTFGTSYLSNPIRLAVYALVVLALVRLPAARLETALRIGFSAGIVVSAVIGFYLLLTGGHQTDASVLSTGGTRVLALSTAMYAGMGMLLALLLVLWRPDRRHPQIEWIVLTLGTCIQILALGRTTLIGLVVLIAVITLSVHRSRRAFIVGCCAVGILIIGVTLVGRVPLPRPLNYATERVTGTSVSDENVQWRVRAVESVLASANGHLLTGAGFGLRPTFDFNGSQVVVEGGDPHNGYIYLLAGGGVVALFAFCLLIGAVFYQGASRLRSDRGPQRLIVAWAMAAAILFLINVATGPDLSQPYELLTLWLLLGIPFFVFTDTADMEH